MQRSKIDEAKPAVHCWRRIKVKNAGFSKLTSSSVATTYCCTRQLMSKDKGRVRVRVLRILRGCQTSAA